MNHQYFEMDDAVQRRLLDERCTTMFGYRDW